METEEVNTTRLEEDAVAAIAAVVVRAVRAVRAVTVAKAVRVVRRVARRLTRAAEVETAEAAVLVVIVGVDREPDHSIDRRKVTTTVELLEEASTTIPGTGTMIMEMEQGVDITRLNKKRIFPRGQ